MSDVKVGDKLAFQVGFVGGTYRVFDISKITPSGRIKCGHYTLNPDLTVRGGRGYDRPYRGELLTPKIQEAIQRQEDISAIRGLDFEEAPSDLLNAIASLIRGEE